MSKQFHERIPDSYKMPFGKYKGKPIGNVPAQYLKWVCSNYSPISLLKTKYNEVYQYIKENKILLDLELEMADKDDD